MSLLSDNPYTRWAERQRARHWRPDYPVKVFVQVRTQPPYLSDCSPFQTLGEAMAECIARGRK